MESFNSRSKRITAEVPKDTTHKHKELKTTIFDDQQINSDNDEGNTANGEKSSRVFGQKNTIVT